jgi:hypothetical protein
MKIQCTALFLFSLFWAEAQSAESRPAATDERYHAAVAQIRRFSPPTK